MKWFRRGTKKTPWRNGKIYFVAFLTETACTFLHRDPVRASSPELVSVEATNILRRLERAKQISTPEANAAHDDLMQLDIELFGFEAFAPRVWELRNSVTSYDAWCVAVAESLALPLATLDERLARVRGVSCEFRTPRNS